MSNVGFSVQSSPYSLDARLARSALIKRLSCLDYCSIKIIDAESVYIIGDGQKKASAGVVTDLCVTIQVNSPNFYHRSLTQGALGAAESYCRGEWDCDDLEDLLRVFARNRNHITALNRSIAVVYDKVQHLLNLRNRNSLSGSARNIAQHYDLSNDFFAQFLDRGMNYSSADYTRPNSSLEGAQMDKLERVCQAIGLSPDMHILEIGCGWGGFAVYAAENYRCKVTATTISKAQYEYCLERVRSAGLEDYIKVVQLDYRVLTGEYDRIVSIEMVEAVGDGYLDGYFQCLSRLLKPTGMVFLQAITIEDWRYQEALKRVDFIKKYIFPGSFIPSIARLCKAAELTDLRMVHLFDMGRSYASTLREWKQRFNSRGEAVSRLGFDQRFKRMWNYYLSYCSAGFAEGAISVNQIAWYKPFAIHEQDDQ